MAYSKSPISRALSALIRNLGLSSRAPTTQEGWDSLKDKAYACERAHRNMMNSKPYDDCGLDQGPDTMYAYRLETESSFYFQAAAANAQMVDINKRARGDAVIYIGHTNPGVRGVEFLHQHDVPFGKQDFDSRQVILEAYVLAVCAIENRTPHDVVSEWARLPDYRRW